MSKFISANPLVEKKPASFYSVLTRVKTFPFYFLILQSNNLKSNEIPRNNRKYIGKLLDLNLLTTPTLIHKVNWEMLGKLKYISWSLLYFFRIFLLGLFINDAHVFVVSLFQIFQLFFSDYFMFHVT